MVRPNRNFVFTVLFACPLLAGCSNPDPAVEKLSKLGVDIEKNGSHYVVSLQEYAPIDSRLIDTLNEIAALGAVHFSYTDISLEQFRRFSNRKNVQSLSIYNTDLNLDFTKDFKDFDSLYVLHVSNYQIEKQDIDFLLERYPRLQIYVLNEKHFTEIYKGAAYSDF